MRLELRTRVQCTDRTFGSLADVVIDPTTKRVTHLVVNPDRDQWLARLVPIDLVEPAEGEAGAIRVRSTVEQVRQLPSVQRIDYLRMDGFPLEDPDWEVGIQEVFAHPYYPTDDLELAPVEFVFAYDRIPKGEVEIRRSSPVESADGHRLGHVDGFLVDADNLITHVVLGHGDVSGRHDVTVPIGGVANFQTDVVKLRLTKDEVAKLPKVPVRRWSPPGRHTH